MFVLIRAVTWATLFIGFVLVFLPARLISWSGVSAPAAPGWIQVVGTAMGVAGAVVALSCVVAFAVLGKGTPAPFDAPRRLVVRGPYRFVRNPMYLGAALALGGAALVYESWPLLTYVGAFLLVTHLFVVGYEEPTLRRSFGDDYAAYCRQVRRWWPTL